MEEEKVVPTEEVAQEEVVVEETQETPVEEEEKPVVVEPPRKKSAQERIDELTRKRREAEREAEYWKKAAIEKEKASKPLEPETPAIPKRPTLDQFETTEQYEDALFEWRDKKREIETRTKRQQEDQEAAFRTFNERANKIRAEHDDFDEVAERPVFSPAMRDALAINENGPELVYYLGNNEAEAARIRSLPVIQQLVEIGRLEQKLLLAKKTQKVTKAPPPPNPVGMSGATEIDESKLSTAEWIKLDRQREIERIKKKFGG